MLSDYERHYNAHLLTSPGRAGQCTLKAGVVDRRFDCVVGLAWAK